MKKLVVTALTMALILCSCGEMKNISFSEMSAEMKNASGRELTDKDIKEDDCYIIGISEKTYKSCIESAAVFSPAFSSNGFEIILIKAKTSIDAERLCAEMKSNYEPAPCDPAENTEFLYYRDYVLFAKGGLSDTDRVSAVFLRLLKK